MRREEEASRERIVALESALRNHEENWTIVQRAVLTPPPPSFAGRNGGRAFTSVADALRAAAEQWPDLLTVWDSATRSAEQSLFENPAKAFQALQAIAEVGAAYFASRNGGPPLGPLDRALQQRVPFKFANHESQTTMSLFGAERVFSHDTQTRQMQRHLTLGRGGKSGNCLQIYFDFDDSTQRVCIGYCGPHLRYCKMRT
jgi:hypothetical protein